MASWTCILNRRQIFQIVLVALLAEATFAATTMKPVTGKRLSVAGPEAISLSVPSGKTETLKCDNINKTITVSSAKFSPLPQGESFLRHPVCDSASIAKALVKRCDGQSSCKVTIGSGSVVKINGEMCSTSWPLLVSYTCKLTFPTPGMEKKLTTANPGSTSARPVNRNNQRSMMTMELID